MSNFFALIIAFVLILLNAFFVAAEFSMVKLRHTRVASIKKFYGVRGRILAEVHKHLDAYLSACQLGITLASIGLGWVGEPAFAHLVVPIFNFFNVDSPTALHAASLTTAFVLISFLHIVVGELLPKSIAIRQAEKISIWTALPLYGFYWLMYPAIWVMNTCSNALLRLTRFAKAGQGDSFYSTDEIKLILSSSFLHGELSKEEKRILEHTLDLGDLKVTDVMRPAEEMITVSTDQKIADIISTMLKYRYSRYPVYDKKEDRIIGIIHVKDIFSSFYQKKNIVDIKSIMRPVLKVTRRLPALELLRKFREGMPHFALVYSGDNIIGFVTLDNLLHVLVGRIKDEFNRTRDDWVKEEDGSFLMPGNASVYSLERALDIDIEAEDIDEEVDTITGLILSRLMGVPKTKERVSFNQFDIVVTKMRGPRILQVRVYPKTYLTGIE